MTRARLVLMTSLLVSAACGAPAPAEQHPVAPPAPVVAPVAAPTSTAAPDPPAAPPPLVVRFHREVEAKVISIALERPPHAAALGADAAWIHDARGWREGRLPASARRGPRPALSVFYGRDDRIRVVGSRPGGAVYLRWLPSGFSAAGKEIGKLADLKGALVAVLGTADPEIVCRPGDICIVKRRTGWTMMAAPADIARVTLGDGVGWAVAGRRLLRLGAGWESAGAEGTWSAADALFATRDRAWIVETDGGRIHAFDGAAWSVAASPIDRPRALWGARPDALWLAGEGGLAFFDGRVWRRVADAPAPLAAVAGRSADDVWIGGDPGLFRIERGE